MRTIDFDKDAADKMKLAVKDLREQLISMDMAALREEQKSSGRGVGVTPKLKLPSVEKSQSPSPSERDRGVLNRSDLLEKSIRGKQTTARVISNKKELPKEEKEAKPQETINN